MTREVRVEPEAIAEIIAAAQWYASRRAGLGDEFASAVFDRISASGRFPEAATPVHGLEGRLIARQVRLRRFPYLVVYVVAADVIRVVAVAHERQLPGYWESRLAPEPASLLTGLCDSYGVGQNGLVRATRRGKRSRRSPPYLRSRRDLRVRCECRHGQNNVGFVGASAGAPRSGGIAGRDASVTRYST